jgi:hypothetical protein
MHFRSAVACAFTGSALALACVDSGPQLTDPGSPTGAVTSFAVDQAAADPRFNLEIILRSPTGDPAFGHVKFRQPKDDLLIIELGTWVRDLAPSSSFVLQRAVDSNLDGVCTSAGWLTLGKGLVPQALNTDASGTAREELSRNVSAFPVGAKFDIHFRVVDAATQSVVVLASDCYQFTINQ